MIPHEHNIWVLLFEQTPVIFRWILTILTAGLFWLARQLYLAHKQRIDRLEILIKTQHTNTDNKIETVSKKVDTLIIKLIP